IDNLLESVAIEVNEDRLEYARHDVRQIIDEALTLVRPILRQKHQTTAIELDQAPETVEVDAKRILQVLVNLLSNASKYSPEGSSITLTVDAVAHNLRIVLADQGPGLGDEDGAMIFERYYRAPSLSAGQAGMGLGLWVVRSIVERHGGWVEAQSRPEGGSVFRVFVPCQRRNHENPGG
ncbi:MAG: ATP-binding protein, partial [Wenzhouxiangellaceae bacterium]|nr:ATP-binding protein [Wenzhouxiangellaceae bacterium]